MKEPALKKVKNDHTPWPKGWQPDFLFIWLATGAWASQFTNNMNSPISGLYDGKHSASALPLYCTNNIARDVIVVQAGTPGATATDQVSRAAQNTANQKALNDAKQAAQEQRDIELIKLASLGADQRTQSMLAGLQSFMNPPKPQPSQDVLYAAAESSVNAKRKVDALKYKLRIFPKESNIYKNALKEIVSFSSGVPEKELSDDVMSEIIVDDVLKYS